MNYKLTTISAVSLDGVIGVGDEIPWYIPEDFKHFRKTTMGHTLVVGSHTYKILPPKAFEGRDYIVLSRTLEIDPENNPHNIVVVRNKKELTNHLHEKFQNQTEESKVFVIGGGMVYYLLLEDCEEAIITWVNKTISNGDKHFPINELFNEFNTINETEWMESRSGLTYKITHYKKSL